jgi:antitoxin YefM
MPAETSYTHLRENLAGILDDVIAQQDVVIVRRKEAPGAPPQGRGPGSRPGLRPGSRDVALIPATELAGLIETAHLLRSPRNARRLLAALRRAETGKVQPTNVRDLRREIVGGP